MPAAIRESLIVCDSVVCADASKPFVVNANVFQVVAITPGDASKPTRVNCLAPELIKFSLI
ncbi:hypothetical protein L291_3599 [Acinetobacter guillouiae MSP4-18]|nr:hypothetical protein L291_3599 [Acinetobacter guillouiae MSP4-18]